MYVLTLCIIFMLGTLAAYFKFFSIVSVIHTLGVNSVTGVFALVPNLYHVCHAKNLRIR